jgi:tRNA(Ile2) C34 agmatinyltransferase TiaS
MVRDETPGCPRMMRQSEHDFLFEVARCVINSLAPLIYWPSVLCAYCRTAKNSKGRLRCAQ